MHKSATPYSEFGRVLLERLGSNRTLTWLADQATVSTVAVSLWASGKCRPRPQRLGKLAAILEFSTDDLPMLTGVTGYETDTDYEIVLDAYCRWYDGRDTDRREKVRRDTVNEIVDKTIALIATNKELHDLFHKIDPKLLEEINRYLCDLAGLSRFLVTPEERAIRAYEQVNWSQRQRAQTITAAR